MQKWNEMKQVWWIMAQPKIGISRSPNCPMPIWAGGRPDFWRVLERVHMVNGSCNLMQELLGWGGWASHRSGRSAESAAMGVENWESRASLCSAVVVVDLLVGVREVGMHRHSWKWPLSWRIFRGWMAPWARGTRASSVLTCAAVWTCSTSELRCSSNRLSVWLPRAETYLCSLRPLLGYKCLVFVIFM